MKTKLVLLATLFLVVGLFFMVTPAAAACFQHASAGVYVCDARPVQRAFSIPDYRANSLLFDRTYAWVDDHASFYEAPGGQVVDQANVGQLFYTLEETRTDANGQTWFRVDDRWTRAENVHHYEESKFAGVRVSGAPERPFGWMIKKIQPSPAPNVDPLEDASWLERYNFIQIHDAVKGSDGWVWYDIGNGQWVKQIYVGLVTAKPRPEGVGEDEFWVAVDLFEQTFAAYEGDRMVFATLVSTGVDGWETNEGLFTTYTHYREWTMWGGDPDDYYYLQDVPHTMFFDGEIALHGAYWHDNFGYMMSHGCVNMPPHTAEWLFHWMEEGPNEDLWVWVYSSHRDQLLELF